MSLRMYLPVSFFRNERNDVKTGNEVLRSPTICIRLGTVAHYAPEQFLAAGLPEFEWYRLIAAKHIKERHECTYK